MNSLHWRKHTVRQNQAPAYSLSWELIPGVPRDVVTIKGPELIDAWTARIRALRGHGPVFPVRCRTLHEAADCARRWAEYRGFKVASRFPEGRSHE